MNEMAAAAPVHESNRINSLDVVRGVVLLGILLMNITMFGLGPAAYGNPAVLGGDTGPNLWSWIVTNVFFEGTQRALFSLLFGAGAFLLITRIESAGRHNAADIYYRRTIWLIVFGLIHAYLLLWTGEILYSYGMAGLFLYPFRRLRPRRLATLAAGLFLVGAVWNYVDYRGAVGLIEEYARAQAVVAAGETPTREQEAAIKGYEELRAELAPVQEDIDEMIETYHGGYLNILGYQAPKVAHYQSWWFYRYTIFDQVSVMLIGMVLFQLGVLTLKSRSSVYWTMVVIGYGVGLAVNVWETLRIIEGGFEIPAIMLTWATYDLGRLGMACGHLGLLLLFCRSTWLPWLRDALAAVGRMALSNYIGHSIVCALFFYGFGLGYFARLQRYELYYVVFAIWAAQLVISPLWLRYYHFGPFEWLWRSLTYVSWQRFRRREFPIEPVPATQLEPALDKIAVPSRVTGQSDRR